MIQIFVVVITISFTLLTAFIDAEHINKEEYITTHCDRWLQRLCFFFSFLVVHPFYSLASALIFTFFFDQILNISRHKPLLYLGTVSKWDRFFNDKIALYISVKLSSLLIALYILIYLPIG